MVYINTGKDKRKVGEVIKVLVKEQRAIVKGMNMVKKSAKPSAQNPQGGIIEIEAPIHISNLNPVDANGKPTRVGRKVVDGKNVRYAKSTGEVIKDAEVKK